MIDVKIIRKPKGTGKPSGGSGTYYGAAYSGEALHAAKADLAVKAEEAAYAAKAGKSDHARQSEYAVKAGYASRAAYADKAGELSEELYDRFLRKDRADTARGEITLAGGSIIKSHQKSDDFNAATAVFDGTGYGVYKDAEGYWHIETDFLTTRMKAIFASLEVRETLYSGGNEVKSPAGARIAMVKEIKSGNTVTGWWCFFPAKNSDGVEISNHWQVGDQARCQTFNLESQERWGEKVSGNVYYWRLVTTVSPSPVPIDGKEYHYIVLSNLSQVNTLNGDQYNPSGPSAALMLPTPMQGFQSNSDAPWEGDSVVCLGSQKYPGTRGSAIIIAVTGDNTPATSYYQNIGTTPFSLTGCLIGRESPQGFVWSSSLFKLTTGALDSGGTPKTIDEIINGFDVTGVTFTLKPSAGHVQLSDTTPSGTLQCDVIVEKTNRTEGVVRTTYTAETIYNSYEPRHRYELVAAIDTVIEASDWDTTQRDTARYAKYVFLRNGAIQVTEGSYVCLALVDTEKRELLAVTTVPVTTEGDTDLSETITVWTEPAFVVLQQSKVSTGNNSSAAVWNDSQTLVVKSNLGDVNITAPTSPAWLTFTKPANNKNTLIVAVNGNNPPSSGVNKTEFTIQVTVTYEGKAYTKSLTVGVGLNRIGSIQVQMEEDELRIEANRRDFDSFTGGNTTFENALEYNAEGLTNIVSEHLEVGGENLWKNGDFSSGLQRYTRGNVGACTVIERGSDGPSVADFFLRMMPVAQSYNGIYATSDNQPCIPLTSGQTYTLSLFARAQFAGQRLYFGQEYEDGQNAAKNNNTSVLLSTSWARYKKTFEVTSGNTVNGQMFIVFQPKSSEYGYVDITGIKLEVGSIATDYSPNTVDLWSMIRQTARSINMLVNSNVVNLLKDSMFETIGSNGAANSGSPWTTPRANSNNRVYPIAIEKNAFDGFTGIKTKSGYAGERYLYCQAMVREDGDYDENVSLIDPGNRYVLSFWCKGVGRLVVFAYMGSGTTPLAQTPVYVDGVLTSTSSDRNVIANINMSDTWTRHHVAFAAETSLEDDGTYILGFQGGSDTTEAHICMPMLEKVTSIPRTPSDWTPRTSGLAKTGIDVINGLITLDAAMVQIKNGSQTAAMFSGGKIRAALLEITDTLIANAINGKVLNLSQGATLNNVVMNNSSITGILQTKEVYNHTPGTITVKKNPSGSSEVQLANTIRCGVSGANDQIIDFSNLYVGCMDITIINVNGLDPGTGAKTGIKAVSIKVGANQSYTTIYLFKNIPLTIKLIGNTAYIVSGTYTT